MQTTMTLLQFSSAVYRYLYMIEAILTDKSNEHMDLNTTAAASRQLFIFVMHPVVTILSSSSSRGDNCDFLFSLFLPSSLLVIKNQSDMFKTKINLSSHHAGKNSQ